jgi:hypothetical protein
MVHHESLTHCLLIHLLFITKQNLRVAIGNRCNWRQISIICAFEGIPLSELSWSLLFSRTYHYLSIKPHLGNPHAVNNGFTLKLSWRCDACLRAVNSNYEKKNVVDIVVTRTASTQVCGGIGLLAGKISNSFHNSSTAKQVVKNRNYDSI